MIRTITPATMRQLETDYMREKGIPGILLMEQAAAAVANAIAGIEKTSIFALAKKKSLMRCLLFRRKDVEI